MWFFLFGLFLGGAFGCLAMALAVAADEERHERRRREYLRESSR